MPFLGPSSRVSTTRKAPMASSDVPAKVFPFEDSVHTMTIRGPHAGAKGRELFPRQPRQRLAFVTLPFRCCQRRPSVQAFGNAALA